MGKHTITLGLEGEVSLENYSRALRDLTLLVGELANEVAGGAEIKWIVEDLAAGSATATLEGFYQDSQLVERVVVAYEEIGESVQNSLPFPYSEKIRKRVSSMTTILNGEITAIRFETPNKDSFITNKAEKGEKSPGLKFSLGSVKGTVQTLTSRGGFRFTIWDSIFDRAVSCYLSNEQEEKMRDAWGKRAIVSGRVGRRPDTGIPVVIRGISDIQVIPQHDPGSYRHARGTVPWKKGNQNPEEVIRGLRNA